MLRNFRAYGGRAFVLIWAGQVMSIVGTSMTRFALIIRVYEEAGTATAVALVGFSELLPRVLVGPFAGEVVDRLDRRLVMLLSDAGAGLMTLILILLVLGGDLAIWQVYILVGVQGFLAAFQSPAYTAASSVLLPKSQYGRANGLRSLAERGADLIAPFVATLLLRSIGLVGVLVADILTFLVALVTLLLVEIPPPPPAEDDAPALAYWGRLAVGWRFIVARPGLYGLLLVMVAMNFADGLTYSSVLPVMVLGKTGGNELSLAIVQGALGVGGVIGAVIMSTTGGTRRKIHGVLLLAGISFLFGDGQLGLGDSVWRWALAGFTAAVFIPIISASYRTIWQLKTPAALQGRVFATQGTLQLSFRPLGYLMAGPLADRVLDPLLSGDGAFATTFVPLVGSGPGAGVAFMFLLTAVFGATMSLSGYLFPAVRNVERDLPDA